MKKLAISSSSSPPECCMCGDLGFQDRLFRCRKCKTRVQHVYCSRYYSPGTSEETYNICEWCLDQDRKLKKPQTMVTATNLGESMSRIASSQGSKPSIKIHFKLKKSTQPASTTADPNDANVSHSQTGSHNKHMGGTARRYKLLSDVLC